MLRYKTVTAVALLGLFLACSSSDDDDDDSSGTSTGTATASTGTGTGATTGGTSTGTATASTGTGTGTTTGGTSTGTATASTGTGTGTTTGGTSTGTATASTGTGTGTVTGGDLPDGGDPFNDEAPNAEDACAVLSIGAQGKPAILVMVIDKSTSMNENAPSTGNQSKWEATRDALIAAIPNLPDTLAVGTVYYPNTSQQGADPQGCEDASSLIIAPGPMSDPAHEQNLIAGVQAVPNPTTPPGTPTYDAYLIGIQLLQATLANPPPGFEDATGYVMLATDGMPTHTSNCGPAFGQGNSPRMAVSNAEWQEILDLGSSVADQGINTFVVGVPGSENRNQVPCRDASGQPTLDNSCNDTDPAQIDYVPMAKLSELARMGRTAVDGCADDGPRYCHIDLTGTDDLVIGLQAAIGTIAQSIVSCEYRVPTEQEIQQQAGPNVFINHEKVVVEYYVGGAATPTSLARSQDGCATGAWQYNADYTQITLCDSMCETVKADPYAAIKINFGCVIPL